jgi:hypothetical protein
MAEKDLKDMTAAELLRWAANGEPNEYGNTVVHLKLLAALGGKLYSETTYDEDAQNIRALADKIDAEIEAARREVSEGRFFKTLDTLIEAHDYPNRRAGEVLSEWLERCFIPRPRDKAGEPVQFGDSNIDWDYTAECRVPGAWWNATAVDCSGRLLATAFCNIVAVAKTDENGRVKPRAPEVLGADGLPIVEGETVYPISGDWIGDPLEVASIDRNGSVRVSLPEGKGWTCYLAKYLDHTPPDTQARIDADARKYIGEYWGCSGILCRNCPVKVGGEKPSERYRTDCCSSAMRLDLLRRQRELDARKGGAE